MDHIGRYRILGELGRGGMGVVYRGEDAEIGRPVAIKTLHPEVDTAGAATDLRDRLRREAQAIGSLSHPNIVMVFDLGQQDTMAYIVMEFIEGSTLDRRLESGDRLTVSEAIQILAQLASALDYAHGRGVVHRDIKPANILLQWNGPAKIADFGIAKITSGQTKTNSGMVVGSANYMAPEQLKGSGISGKTDQFALAVMAYQMLTGAKPFDADTLAALVTKILFQEPPAANTLNQALGPASGSVLAKGMSKDPEARFASCSEFVEQLAGSLDLSSTVRLPKGSLQSAAPVSSGSNGPPEATVVLPAGANSGSVSIPPSPVAQAHIPVPAYIPPPPVQPWVAPVRYAGWWRRVMATGLDLLLIRIATAPFTGPLDRMGEAASFTLYSLLFLSFGGASEIVLHKELGFTPGKWIMRIRVVMADGSPLTWQVAGARFLAKLLNYLTLFASTFMIVFDPERRALEDRMCGTRVIRMTRKAR